MVERRPSLGILAHAIMIFGVLLVVFPIYLAFVASTHTPQEIMQAPMPILPGGNFWESYKAALTGGGHTSTNVSVARMIWVSTVITFIITFGKISISLLSAFAVVYFRFPLRSLCFWLIFITLMLPVEVRILPTYKVLADLNMLNTYAGLTVPLIASATATFLFRQFFLSVPDELVEAARIDGAGPMRFFKDILVPLSQTSIAALFVIQFIYGWNQYLWPLLATTTEDMYPVVIGIKRMIASGDAAVDWNLVMATAILALIPPAVVVVLMQRWFVKGPKANQVIHGVSAEVEAGEFIVIVGPSGCGKSTLLRMVAGLEEVSAGDIAIGNKVVNDVEPAKRDIAMVFQNYALYPHMRVFDNMAYGLRIAGVGKDEIKTRVDKAAKILELGHLLERKPRELSGGQRQRVAMGRAIVRQPQVFLFDEPLSNLDAKLRVAMRAEIKALHQRLKTTTVYVTHDQIEAMTMADRIVVMHDGIIEQIGTPLELYDRPGNLFVAQFIGSPAMNVVEGVARQVDGVCQIEAQGSLWPAPPGLAAPDNTPVHYGIRPGDITLADPGRGVPARVVVVEPTGAETELLLSVGDAQLVVTVHGRVEVGPDDEVGLVVDARRAHLFDRASGRRMV